MTRTKTIEEIQAEYTSVKDTITSLTAEQAKLQHRLIALNLLQQVKQHGVARSQTTWFVVGDGN
jgi:hypothetical protein